MPRPALTIAKDGPPDHVGAADELVARALEHIRASEVELLSGLKHNAAEARKHASNPLVKAGVADELRRLADAMEAAAQRIAAVSSKGMG